MYCVAQTGVGVDGLTAKQRRAELEVQRAQSEAVAAREALRVAAAERDALLAAAAEHKQRHEQSLEAAKQRLSQQAFTPMEAPS